jgi:fucose permease
MIVFPPLFSYGFSIASIVSSAMALRKGERRGINILLIVLCTLIILATTAGHAWFWWFCILNGA